MQYFSISTKTVIQYIVNESLGVVIRMYKDRMTLNTIQKFVIYIVNFTKITMTCDYNSLISTTQHLFAGRVDEWL